MGFFNFFFFGSKKQSGNKSTKAQNSPKRGLQLEPLEQREMLAALPLATFSGEVYSGTPVTEYVSINSSTFKEAVLEFNVSNTGGSFDPSVIKIYNSAEQLITNYYVNFDGNTQKPSIFTASLAPDMYRIEFSGDNNTFGTYKLDVFLAGAGLNNSSNTVPANTSLLYTAAQKQIDGTINRGDIIYYSTVLGSAYTSNVFASNPYLDILNTGRLNQDNATIISQNASAGTVTAEHQVIHKAPNAPGTPIVSGSVNTSEITITWAPSISDATHYAPAEYIIEYSIDETNWTKYSTVDMKVLKETIPNLDAGTKYYFRVTASNNGGTATSGTSAAIQTRYSPTAGSFSVGNVSDVTSTTIDVLAHCTDRNQTPPTDTTYLKVTGISSVDITLNPTSITVEDIQSALALATDNKSVVFKASPGLFKDLAKDATFTFTFDYIVELTNDSGIHNSATNTVTVTVVGTYSKPQSAPTGLVGTAPNSGQISLEWTAPAGETITGYQIQYRKKGSPWPTDDSNTISISGSTTTKAKADGLDPNTEYEFRIQTVNNKGESDWSQPSAFATTLLPKPTNFAATTPVWNETKLMYDVTLSWTNDTDVTGYILSQAIGSSTLYWNGTAWVAGECLVAWSGTGITVSQPVSTGQTQYIIQAVTSGASTNHSEKVDLNVGPQAAPAVNQTTKPTISDITDVSLTLAWTWTQGTTPNIGLADTFVIQYREVDSLNWILDETIERTDGTYVSGTWSYSKEVTPPLLPNKNYEFQIVTNGTAGQTSTSSVSDSVWTLLKTPVITGVTQAWNKANQAYDVTLDWSSIPVTVETGFTLQYYDPDDGWTDSSVQPVGAATTVTVSQAPEKTVAYRLKATRSTNSNQSDWSVPVSVETQAAVTAPVIKLIGRTWNDLDSEHEISLEVTVLDEGTSTLWRYNGTTVDGPTQAEIDSLAEDVLAGIIPPTDWVAISLSPILGEDLFEATDSVPDNLEMKVYYVGMTDLEDGSKPEVNVFPVALLAKPAAPAAPVVVAIGTDGMEAELWVPIEKDLTYIPYIQVGIQLPVPIPLTSGTITVDGETISYTVDVDDDSDPDNFIITFTDLIPATEYKFLFVAENYRGETEGNFEKLDAMPDADELAATITPVGTEGKEAKLDVPVVQDTLIVPYIQVGTEVVAIPLTSGSITVDGETISYTVVSSTITFTNLVPATEYEFFFTGQNVRGTTTGDSSSLVALIDVSDPVIDEAEITDRTVTIDLSGLTYSADETWVLKWDYSDTPTVPLGFIDDHRLVETDFNDGLYVVSGLRPDTGYVFWFEATNARGTAISGQVDVTTLESQVPYAFESDSDRKWTLSDTMGEFSTVLTIYGAAGVPATSTTELQLWLYEGTETAADALTALLTWAKDGAVDPKPDGWIPVSDGDTIGTAVAVSVGLDDDNNPVYMLSTTDKDGQKLFFTVLEKITDGLVENYMIYSEEELIETAIPAFDGDEYTPVTDFAVDTTSYVYDAIEGTWSVDVSWTAPDDVDVLYYIVEYKDGMDWVWLADSTDVTVTLTGLDGGVNYLIQVTAVVKGTDYYIHSVAEDSDWNFWTPSGDAIVLNNGDNIWQADEETLVVSGLEDGEEYTLFYRESGSGASWSAIPLEAMADSEGNAFFDLTGLTAGTPYDFVLYQSDDIPKDSADAPIDGIIGADWHDGGGFSAAIAEYVALTTGDSSIVVTYLTQPDVVYLLRLLWIDGVAPDEYLSLSVDLIETMWDNLVPNTDYVVEVTKVDATDRTPLSFTTRISTRTLLAAAPTVTATAASESKIDVSWAATVGDYYKIDITGGTTGTEYVQVGTVDASDIFVWTFTGGTATTLYTFTVTRWSSDDDSGYELSHPTTVSETTLTPTPPVIDGHNVFTWDTDALNYGYTLTVADGILEDSTTSLWQWSENTSPVPADIDALMTALIDDPEQTSNVVTGNGIWTYVAMTGNQVSGVVFPGGNDILYYYAVIASTIDALYTASTVTPPPLDTGTKPDGAAGVTQVTLEWTVSTSGTVDSHEILQSSDGESWTKVDGIFPNPAGTVITGLTSGQAYYFRIVTYFDDGSVTVSESSDAVLTLLATPDAPTVGTPVWNETSGKYDVVLTWSEITNADSYLIECSPDGLTSWVTVTGAEAVTELTYTHSTNEAGTYYYRITAENEAGAVSDPSAASDVIIIMAAPTVAGTEIGTSGVYEVGSEITMTWTPAAGYSYIVEIWDGDDWDLFSTSTMNHATGTATFDAPITRSEITYRIVGSHSTEPTCYSIPITISYGRHEAPIVTAASSQEELELELSWTAASSTTYYQIMVYDDDPDSGGSLLMTDYIQGGDYLFDSSAYAGIDYDTEYWFVVTRWSNGSGSGYAQSASATGSAWTNLAAPTGTADYVADQHKIILTMPAVGGSDTYTLYWDDSSPVDTGAYTVSLNSGTVTITITREDASTLLQEETEYTFYVGYEDGDVSKKTFYVTVETIAANLIVNGVASIDADGITVAGQLTVSWVWSQGSGAVTTEFFIEYGQQSDFPAVHSSHTAASTETSYTFGSVASPLPAGTDYWVRITALAGIGDYAMSPVVETGIVVAEAPKISASGTVNSPAEGARIILFPGDESGISPGDTYIENMMTGGAANEFNGIQSPGGKESTPGNSVGLEYGKAELDGSGNVIYVPNRPLYLGESVTEFIRLYGSGAGVNVGPTPVSFTINGSIPVSIVTKSLVIPRTSETGEIGKVEIKNDISGREYTYSFTETNTNTVNKTIDSFEVTFTINKLTGVITCMGLEGTSTTKSIELEVQVKGPDGLGTVVENTATETITINISDLIVNVNPESYTIMETPTASPVVVATLTVTDEASSVQTINDAAFVLNVAGSNYSLSGFESQVQTRLHSLVQGTDYSISINRTTGEVSFGSIDPTKFDFIAEGATLTLMFNAQIETPGGIAGCVVEVLITGVNQDPTAGSHFLWDISANEEIVVSIDGLRQSGAVHDVDLGDDLTFRSIAGYSGFEPGVAFYLVESGGDYIGVEEFPVDPKDCYGKIVVAEGGKYFTYTPIAGEGKNEALYHLAQGVQVTFPYAFTVEDKAGESATGTLMQFVTGTKARPVATKSDPLVGSLGATGTLDLSEYFYVDSTTLTYSIVGSHATDGILPVLVSIAGNELSATFISAASITRSTNMGPVTVLVRATDPGNGSFTDHAIEIRLENPVTAKLSIVAEDTPSSLFVPGINSREIPTSDSSVTGTYFISVFIQDLLESLGGIGAGITYVSFTLNYDPTVCSVGEPAIPLSGANASIATPGKVTFTFSSTVFAVDSDNTGPLMIRIPVTALSSGDVEFRLSGVTLSRSGGIIHATQIGSNAITVTQIVSGSSVSMASASHAMFSFTTEEIGGMMDSGEGTIVGEIIRLDTQGGPQDNDRIASEELFFDEFGANDGLKIDWDGEEVAYVEDPTLLDAILEDLI